MDIFGIKDIILLLICAAASCLGMSVRILQQSEFTNHYSFLKKCIVSIFLSIIVGFFIDISSPGINISDKNLAILKIISCALAAGFFYQETLNKLDILYRKVIMDKIDRFDNSLDKINKGKKQDEQ